MARTSCHTFDGPAIESTAPRRPRAITAPISGPANLRERSLENAVIGGSAGVPRALVTLSFHEFFEETAVDGDEIGQLDDAALDALQFVAGTR